MKLKIVSGIMLTLLITGMLTLAFNIQPVKASGTIYIRSDGSIDPPTANITTVDNITYTFIGNINQSIIVERDNIVVDGAGYTIEGTGIGNSIDISYRRGVAIKNMEIREFQYGILLYKSSSNTISGNKITANNDDGIYLIYSSNNTISGNNITNNRDGIGLGISSNNRIYGNNITANDSDGIHLSDSSNYNSMCGNNITANYRFGILLYSSSNNVLRNNHMNNNKYNFGVSGWDLADFVNDVDTSNTVDGKPIYYWVNERDRAVPSDAGFVVLVNCANITVENLTLKNNWEGVLLAYTTNSMITENDLANNGEGIRLYASSNNSIYRNDITNNDWLGIDLDASSNNSIYQNNITAYIIGISLKHSTNNTLINNNITNGLDGIDLFVSSYNTINGNNVAENNVYGMFLTGSSYNTILGNKITNNVVGILLYSSNNTIYHNSFVDNTKQVPPYDSTNVWDDGYPSGGNYWSDYISVDAKSGPHQNLTGVDGIWDTPYVIDENNQDNYPLVSPYWYWSNPIIGDFNKDMVVDIDDMIIPALAFGSYPGHPRWNPIADLTGDELVDIDDVMLVAIHFGEHI